MMVMMLLWCEWISSFKSNLLLLTMLAPDRDNNNKGVGINKEVQ